MHIKFNLMWSLLYCWIFTFAIYLHGNEDVYIHIFNEKFNLSPVNNTEFDNDLKNASDEFLREVWQEAVAQKKDHDIQQINQIAYEKLCEKSKSTEMLYENGLRIENPLNRVATSNYNDSLSMIARVDEDYSAWKQGHPLAIVFNNYALEKKNMINGQVFYSPNLQQFTLAFDVSPRKEMNGQTAQENFYSWTSSFSSDEKENWRMAIIASNRIISAPILRAPLRENFSLSINFTQRNLAQLGFECDENFYKSLFLDFGRIY